MNLLLKNLFFNKIIAVKYINLLNYHKNNILIPNHTIFHDNNLSNNLNHIFNLHIFDIFNQNIWSLHQHIFPQIFNLHIFDIFNQNIWSLHQHIFPQKILINLKTYLSANIFKFVHFYQHTQILNLKQKLI